MRNIQGKVRNLSHLHILNCSFNELPVVLNFLADFRNIYPKKVDTVSCPGQCGSVGWSIVPWTERLKVWFPAGTCRRGWPIDGSLSFSLPSLSLSLTTPFPLLLKAMKINVLGWGVKKIDIKIQRNLLKMLLIAFPRQNSNTKPQSWLLVNTHFSLLLKSS